MKLFGNLAFAAVTALAVTACAKADNNVAVPTLKGIPNSEALDAFTTVAESSVNSVVSIKSFATVRQRNGYYGQSDEFFSDPFFDFFLVLRSAAHLSVSSPRLILMMSRSNASWVSDPE